MGIMSFIHGAYFWLKGYYQTQMCKHSATWVSIKLNSSIKKKRKKRKKKNSKSTFNINSDISKSIFPTHCQMLICFNKIWMHCTKLCHAAEIG